jgi:hypothetical protein
MHPQVHSSKPSRMYWIHTTNQEEEHGLRIEAHQMHPQVGSSKQGRIYRMHTTNPRTTLVAHHSHTQANNYQPPENLSIFRFVPHIMHE